MKNPVTTISTDILAVQLNDRASHSSANTGSVASENEPRSRAHIVSRRAARWARRANH